MQKNPFPKAQKKRSQEKGGGLYQQMQLLSEKRLQKWEKKQGPRVYKNWELGKEYLDEGKQTVSI